jgi:hypothetical protein
MKKIILSLAVLALFLTSCNLDEQPQGVIPKDGSIQTVEDAEGWMRYEYIYLRALTAGSYIYTTEIASDFFNPSIDYGNREGSEYRWDWNSGDPFVDIWGNAYSAINHACYVIETVGEMDKSGLDASEVKRLEKVVGVAYFIKAYFGLKLLEYYAPIYNSANKDKYGIMLVDLHRPSGDITTYPGRSTVAESYQWVIDNLTEAESRLGSYAGAVGSEELTIDAVRALQARIALYMGNWDEAIAKSTSLVDGGKYPLCETQAEMTDLWTNDSGKECIVQLYANLGASSTPSSNDPSYFNYNPSNGQYRPDWIPNKWVATSLYPTTDLRFSTWLKTGLNVTVSIGVASGITLFNKFAGNPALAESETAHINKIKLFRIAEQYLIAAEAFAMKGGADAVACSYLDKLCGKRDPSHASLTLTGDALKNYIKEERAKEFIGEGFRWFDLKRWGEGMAARPDPQLKAIIHTGGSNEPALNLAVSSSDHRWVAPIPVDELAANPQIRDQQNPGY